MKIGTKKLNVFLLKKQLLLEQVKQNRKGFSENIDISNGACCLKYNALSCKVNFVAINQII